MDLDAVLRLEQVSRPRHGRHLVAKTNVSVNKCTSASHICVIALKKPARVSFSLWNTRRTTRSEFVTYTLPPSVFRAPKRPPAAARCAASILCQLPHLYHVFAAALLLVPELDFGAFEIDGSLWFSVRVAWLLQVSATSKTSIKYHSTRTRRHCKPR